LNECETTEELMNTNKQALENGLKMKTMKIDDSVEKIIEDFDQWKSDPSNDRMNIGNLNLKNLQSTKQKLIGEGELTAEKY
jgi:hypothetical protein